MPARRTVWSVSNDLNHSSTLSLLAFLRARVSASILALYACVCCFAPILPCARPIAGMVMEYNAEPTAQLVRPSFRCFLDSVRPRRNSKATESTKSKG